MSKVPTERVTVRLNKQHLTFIDNMSETGQIRNRTHAIAEAVRDWVNKKSLEVTNVMQAAKGQMELQKVLAQMTEMKSQISKMQKK